MKLNLKLKLTLPTTVYPTYLTTQTYEKASFDQYLIASLAYHEPDEAKATAYIESLVGQGSLNPHFVSLYAKLHQFSPEDLKKILENSEYPIRKIDSSHSIVYFQGLDISLYCNQACSGNLSQAPDAAEKLLPTYEGERVSFEISAGSSRALSDVYDVHFEDEEITVGLLPNYFAKISEADFNAAFIDRPEAPENYEGIYERELDGQEWSFLDPVTALSLNASENNGFYFDKHFCNIAFGLVRRYHVAPFHGFYIYAMERLAYKELTPDFADMTLTYLRGSHRLSELSISELKELFPLAKPNNVISAFNDILLAKDSTEIARYASSFLKPENAGSWSHQVLVKIKDSCPMEVLPLLYQCAPGLFKLQDLLYLPAGTLSKEDSAKVEAYWNDREAKIKSISAIYGEIDASGVREQSKRLESNPEVKRFRFLINRNQAHNKDNINKLNDGELDARLLEAQEVQRLLPKIEARLAALDKKKN